MSLIVNDSGALEVGPPEDDPVRVAHARLVRGLAHELEMNQQLFECLDAMTQRHKAAIATLESRVAFLEQLLLGATAASR